MRSTFLLEFFNIKFFGRHYLTKERNKLIKKLYFWKKLNNTSVCGTINAKKKSIFLPPFDLRQFVWANRPKVFERVYEYWC